MTEFLDAQLKRSVNWRFPKGKWCRPGRLWPYQPGKKDKRSHRLPFLQTLLSDLALQGALDDHIIVEHGHGASYHNKGLLCSAESESGEQRARCYLLLYSARGTLALRRHESLAAVVVHPEEGHATHRAESLLIFCRLFPDQISRHFMVPFELAHDNQLFSVEVQGRPRKRRHSNQ